MPAMSTIGSGVLTEFDCQSDSGRATTSSVVCEDNIGLTESGTDKQHASGAVINNESVGNGTFDATHITHEKSSGANSDSRDCISGSGAVVGTKRSRTTYEENRQAVVHVSYDFLSRESKMKLEELLCDWSKWHASHCSSSKDSYDALESGKETYFPALQFGSEKSTVSFLMDNQVRKKQKMDSVLLRGDSVPLYDREYAFALTLSDGSAKENSGVELLNDSRCFNCGCYNHSLKECTKPRDNVAIGNARKHFQLKNNQSGGPRVPTRYYQNTPRGKYDGLKPGVLNPETRELLGLGELDPPPWLNRMRELGYPPGYLDVEDEDQPSGITIYADEEPKIETEDNVKADISEPRKKRTVDFPGIEVPVPENGDQSCWAASEMQLNFTRSNIYPELISGESSYSQIWGSGSPLGLFPSYAQELDSFMSSYSHSSRDLGMDTDRKPGVFAGDNHVFNSVVYDQSRSYNNPNFYHSGNSGQMSSFSRGYRHEIALMPSYSPLSPTYSNFRPMYSRESCSPYSYTPY